MAQWTSSNHNNADEYIGSSLPFASGSISLANNTGFKIKFPYVTRWIQVFSKTGATKVGFTKNGVQGNPATNSNFFSIPAGGSSDRLEIKCIEIWLAGDGGAAEASIVAGYTNIPESKFVGVITGSEGFSGVG